MRILSLSRFGAMPVLILRIMAVGLVTLAILQVTDTSGALPSCSGGVCQHWVARHDGPGNDLSPYFGDEAADAVRVDRHGNAIVVGVTAGEASGRDATIIKYGPQGEVRWQRTFAGPGASDDWFSWVKFDDSGQIYTAGRWGDGAIIAKLTTAGQVLWTHELPGITLSGFDLFGSTVYTLGEFRPQIASCCTEVDLVINAIDSAGNGLWRRDWDSGWSLQDIAAEIRADGQGNPIIVASAYRPQAGPGTWASLLVLKLDQSGQIQWERFYNPLIQASWATGLEVAEDGDIYIAGAVSRPYDPGYLLVLKFDPDGNEVWEFVDEDFISTAFTIDDAENLYLSGTVNPAYNDGSIAVMKVNSNGDREWLSFLNAMTPQDDYSLARSVIVDGMGNVHVAGDVGTSQGWPLTALDIVTAKFSPSGEQVWAARYDGPANSSEHAAHSGANNGTLALDPWGAVLVVGASWGPDWDWVVVKYYDDPNVQSPPVYPPVGGAVDLTVANPETDSLLGEAAILMSAVVSVVGSAWVLRRRPR